MSHPNLPRIPLHSAFARLATGTITGMYALGVSCTSISILKGQEDVHPLALLAISLCFGVMLLMMWDMCQRVYMTCEGIELTSPRRVIPWQQVGDTFRVPMLGSWPSTCCIGIKGPNNWDLQFFGREDFESVVAQFRATNHNRS